MKKKNDANITEKLVATKEISIDQIITYNAQCPRSCLSNPLVMK